MSLRPNLLAADGNARLSSQSTHRPDQARLNSSAPQGRNDPPSMPQFKFVTSPVSPVPVTNSGGEAGGFPLGYIPLSARDIAISAHQTAAATFAQSGLAFQQALAQQARRQQAAQHAPPMTRSVPQFQLATDNLSKPERKNQSDFPELLNLQEAMKGSCEINDMLGVENLPASTNASEPSVLKPFANVFGKKKSWKIDLHKMYFQPLIAEGLLGADSPATQLGKNMTAEEITSQIISIRLISSLSEKEAKEVAFNRDVFHCPPQLLASEDLNKKMLKSAGSAVRSGEEKYRQPSAQVSILIDTLFKHDSDGATVPVSVLSVSAPALDDNLAAMNAINSRPVNYARPEMQTYLDFTSASSSVDPVFKEKNYQEACDSLRKHIMKGARLHSADKAKDPSDRVIMCAYGVNAFLSTLRQVIDAKYGTQYTKLATAIMAKAFAQTIIELRQMGQTVSFSDVSKHVGDIKQFNGQDFWDLVNSNLDTMGADKLKPVNGFDSRLGQDWVKKGDLIINAWDPDALLGNALKKDNSFDGHLGLRTTIHLMHTLACRLFHSLEDKPGAQIKIKLSQK